MLEAGWCFLEMEVSSSSYAVLKIVLKIYLRTFQGGDLMEWKDVGVLRGKRCVDDKAVWYKKVIRLDFMLCGSC